MFYRVTLMYYRVALDPSKVTTFYTRASLDPSKSPLGTPHLLYGPPSLRQQDLGRGDLVIIQGV